MHEALETLTEAVAKAEPHTRRLYFDASGMNAQLAVPAEAALLATTRMRQIGVTRILFGSDGATPGNTPRNAWAAFRKLPLSQEEFRMIAANVPNYLQN